MNKKVNQLITATAAHNPKFIQLEHETRHSVPTEQAAYYMNRRPQTLRKWACYENGPIKPIRIHGRLEWVTSHIRNLYGMEE